MKKAVKIFTAMFLLCACLFFAPDANAFSSQLQYENYVTDGTGSNYLKASLSCSKLKKFVNVLTLNDVYNVVMPVSISQDRDITETDKMLIFAEIYGPIIARAVLYQVLMSQLVVNPLAGAILVGAIATETIVLLDVCTNVYIMQPHEYANYVAGSATYLSKGKDANGRWYNAAPCAATAFDVQYYFQCSNNAGRGYSHSMCDPYVTCDAAGSCAPNGNANCSTANCPLVKPDPFCYLNYFAPRNMKPPISGNLPSNLAGYLVFAHDGGQAGFLSRIFTPRTRFSPQQLYAVNPGGGADNRSVWIGEIPTLFTSFYRVNQSSGSIEACLLAPLTFIPVEVGCAPIAAPLEEVVMKPTFAQRCAYILQPRSDLNSLGSAILDSSLVGGSVASYNIPIGRFLKSDMHFTSTMVGCVQDMVTSILTSDVASSQKSFLEIVQGKMRGVVLATLCLYVALVGIKIMLSEGQLKRSDYIMFLVKFAMVLYLNTASFWCQLDSNGNQGVGVFSALIQGQGELSSMFVGALTDNDPLSQCSYPYKGTQLLTNQVVPASSSGAVSIVPTNGYNGVVLTVWDMIDCKMVNYLNLGSCHYDGMGLLITMIIGLCAMLPLASFIFVGFAYLTVSTIFKFARLSVLVAIVMATLVIVSPIFACFMLFDKTMPMFQAWVKALIGNMLYPAYLMAYFSLMVMTLDTLYYGDINMAKSVGVLSSGQAVSRSSELELACKDSKSVYCATVSRMGDPCANDVSNFASQYASKIQIFPGAAKNFIIKPSVLSKYFMPMIRVLLFSLLFYLLMDASIGFLGALAGAEAVASIGGSGIISGLMNMFLSELWKMARGPRGGGGGQ